MNVFYLITNATPHVLRKEVSTLKYLPLAPIDTMAKRKAATKNKGNEDGDDGCEPKRSKTTKDHACATSPAAADDANDADDDEAVAGCRSRPIIGRTDCFRVPVQILSRPNNGKPLAVGRM